ncbi:HD family phosphohydrolase [Alteromonas facilis]|uniref:HD family phosphohydrolase n=1 Tax=Alteromonas facilis TaxID=2048004 RepID=UPI001F0BDCFF|nr:HD family phosphohydrolase [Alteromonas facilis]
MNNQVLDEMLNVSIALSTEKDTAKLLESILLAAKHLSNADGGTIYSVNDNKELIFDTLINDSLKLHWGGSTGEPIQFEPIPMFENGQVNAHAIVAYAAANNEVINIDDVYESSEFDVEKARRLDKEHDYRTKSVLTIPMINHEGDVNGVLQLINAQDGSGIIPFSPTVQRSVLALASLASVALTNRQLIDAMETLFQSFTQLIAKAIDEKSPYTGGHCRRVPELTMMIAEAVHRHDEGPLADFKMSDADRHELNLAGWIHDCGKVATPEYIMDKSKKLETIFDRIELVKTRFEIAKRDAEIEYYKKLANADGAAEQTALKEALDATLTQLEDDLTFVTNANTGGEFMDASDQERLENIGRSLTLNVDGDTTALLSEDEIYNLRTARGTLNNEERDIINRHMDITVEMLESLPFPKHLQRVPEFAGGHHEKMDGSGYPKGLTRDQMSIPARMMAIADIFEALTASDRPYKEGKKLSECLTIMGRMKLGDHIDPDLFEVFVKQKVHLSYAEKFLKPEQIDDLPLEEIPGFAS